mgnify:CR=1 FL=1
MSRYDADANFEVETIDRIYRSGTDGDWPVREEKACYGLFKVRKVGQIIVLAEWEDSYGHKKRIVLGPYW